MFGSWVLEVAIGLIFVFLLFSTICAAIREGIETFTKTRAAYLERGMRELLHDKQGIGLAKEFYEHPLIYSLYAATEYCPGTQDKKVGLCPSGGELPSYIPAKNFAAAMIDLAARGSLPQLASGPQKTDPALNSTAITAESLRAGIATMENQRVARALLNALDLAQDDLNKTRLNLEAWYDAGMDRVSGWYKRSTQKIVFALAFIMAVALNVDAIGIANFLYQNDNARIALVGKVSDTLASGNHETAVSRQAAEQAHATLGALDLPIGWPAGFEKRDKEEALHWLARIILIIAGWALTALAATLGAPFWFDTLNKVMVIRSTVKPYEKSMPEGSEDRQNPPQTVLTPTVQQAGVTPAIAQAAAILPDRESSIDGCDLGNAALTPDEELPPADGGVLR